MFDVQDLTKESNFSNRDKSFLKNIHISIVVLLGFSFMVVACGKIFSDFNDTRNIFLPIFLLSCLIGLAISGLSLRVLRLSNNK